ncbi:MAG: type IV pilus modification PilV family protein [Planctomycetaceae bacterium]
MDRMKRGTRGHQAWLRSLATASCGAPVFVGYAALLRRRARGEPAMRAAPPAAGKRQAGFSLVEVVLTFSILAIATTALGLVELSNSQRSRELKARDISFSRGQAFMERLLRMPFGAPDPAKCQASDYERLFGSDDDVRLLSLTQLERRDLDGDGAIDEPPLRFALKGVEDAGEWEIYVDRDLDGNGTVEPTVGTVETREGRSDMLRIEFRHNGKTVLKTLRSRTPQERDEEELAGS